MKEELIKEVEELARYTHRTHKYSMSKIYGLYNRVFEKNENPQSCASCLIRKLKELEDWVKIQVAENDIQRTTESDTENQIVDQNIKEVKTKRKRSKNKG